MSDTSTPLDSRQKDIAGFYGKIKAHDILLRLVVLECQKRNPQFAAQVREALDEGLGRVRAANPSGDLDPFALEIDVKMREAVREILDVVENADEVIRKADASMREALGALAPVKPLTLRRRFLNWLERG